MVLSPSFRPFFRALLTDVVYRADADEDMRRAAELCLWAALSEARRKRIELEKLREERAKLLARSEDVGRHDWGKDRHGGLVFVMNVGTL